tara:strand:- start:3746 stop:5557 length:1812 start_codon:yes stop_codon:yes gene_type:complete
MFRILNAQSTLPEIPDTAEEIFLDLETCSGDPNRGALKPYHGDSIAGFAVTWDDHETVYYIPVNHTPERSSLFFRDEQLLNMPEDLVRSFLRELVGQYGRRWINHNVKFDAHFVAQFGVEVRAELVDTLTLSKLASAQNANSYGLKDLAKRWLGIEAEEQDEVKAELARLGSKDYGDVAPEIMGRYACADVNMNRELWKKIVQMRSSSPDVWDLEVRLTRSLFDIERRGLRIDRDQLRSLKISTQSKIAKLETEIHRESKRLGGVLDPMSSNSLSKFFFMRHRLPVINETDTGRPSTDSASLEAWLEDESLEDFHGLIRSVLDHRSSRQFLSLYIEGWSDLLDDRDIIRPSYNQTVRTGRMSSYSPNIQQLNADAKKLIVPSPGNEFLSLDYSQIEFRILSVVCGDQKMISAYRDNPETDFHDYASELCSISRRQAKVVNFGIAFGMGSELLEKSLRAMKSSGMTPTEVLNVYRNKFSKIFLAAERLQKQARSTGFVKTLYGRRRALPGSEARKALNSVVQGTAADIVKEVALHLNTDTKLRELGITVRAIVHDEFLFEAPTGSFDEETLEHIRSIMQRTSIDLPVPLLVDGGQSLESWKAAT